MVRAQVLWERLDTPGHDACVLEEDGGGWKLHGCAVFRSEHGPSRLTYCVQCSSAWQALRGEVHGWLGTQQVNWDLVRSATGGWAVNGQLADHLEGRLDLDLGFTPATNVIPLRRLALAEGQAAQAPAAWFDASAGTLAPLPQRYERRASSSYYYEAHTVPYVALLEVAPSGFILQYPGLWRAVEWTSSPQARP